MKKGLVCSVCNRKISNGLDGYEFTTHKTISGADCMIFKN